MTLLSAVCQPRTNQHRLDTANEYQTIIVCKATWILEFVEWRCLPEAEELLE